MRILILTQWFNPEPVFKGLTFAKELMRRGHKVEVLTGFPNYPDGEIYNGYKVRLKQREVLEGVTVLRVPLYPSHDDSSLKRVANYGSFALSSSILGPLLVSPADVMFVYQPATIGLAAVLLRHLRNMPFVFDVQDLWPDWIEATGMVRNPHVLKLVDIWCKYIYKQASVVTVLSPGFKEALCARGVPANKVEVVYNWCDEDQLVIGDTNKKIAEELGMTGRFNVVFAGTMGRAQALDAVLDAAAILAPKKPDIQFIFIGGGITVPELKQKAEVMNLTNVKFLARRPLSEIGQILQHATVQLIHLKDDPLFSITIPSKTQTSLAIGRPIIMAASGNAAELIEKAGAGITCTPENPSSIADAVERMHQMTENELNILGEKGKRFYQKELSLVAGVTRYEELFNQILRNNIF